MIDYYGRFKMMRNNRDEDSHHIFTSLTECLYKSHGDGGEHPIID